MNSGFVQAGAVRLQYFEHGRGPEVVLFVHGYEASGRIWRLVQEALDPQRFHSIAISNRGAGDSDRSPSEDDYRIESLARDLHEAVLALGLRGFTLVGHSMGGATVVQYALDHPDVPKGLVLLDSVGLDGIPLAPDWESQLRERVLRGEAALDRPRGGATLETPPPEEFRAGLDADRARNPIERLVGSRRSMGEIRLRSRLAELAMPVLVAGGDQDATVGVDQILADFLALPPGRRFLQFFHGVGHSPNTGVPTLLAEVLEGFMLKTLPAVTAVVPIA